ncbi:nucleotidyl transferase AbiEii/AbiGii toxin family protein [Sorangium sp. So ce1036]|uniref:nucleotidyl transferase AbiEii/AbiGii toxin family protein n=1 Tax=Sorangium sp. So ce1036 TaxID=3133328 RepID=UPI003F524550
MEVRRAGCGAPWSPPAGVAVTAATAPCEPGGERFPDVTVPVAQTGHLLALKVLARDDRRRPQDLVDIRTLLAIARDTDIAMARSAVELIEQRGFARGRDLRRLLEEVLTPLTGGAGSRECGRATAGLN